MLGITTYTIVPDVIVVYGCSCGGSVYPKSSVVISGLLHPVTTVEQVVAGTHIVVTHVGVHVVCNSSVVTQSDVSTHVVIDTHVSTAAHTVVVEGWHEHMPQDVVVITLVVVVQLVGQGTVVVITTVTVPMT